VRYVDLGALGAGFKVCLRVVSWWWGVYRAVLYAENGCFEQYSTKNEAELVVGRV